MTHLDLVDGKIHARLDRAGHLEEFSADEDGVRALWKRMIEEEEHGAMQVMCSSSVDFPEDEGLSEDFDLRELLRQMQLEQESQDIRDIFDKIDQLVEKGDIQGLANRCKRYILTTCGKNPDEYNL